MLVLSAKMADRTTFQLLQLLKADTPLAAAEIPEINVAALELGLRESQENSALMQVVGRQFVGDNRSARCPHGMQMCAAAEFRIHAFGRLNMGLVVAQQGLIADFSFNGFARIDDRDGRTLGGKRRQLE